jgi:hypothetical protein
MSPPDGWTDEQFAVRIPADIDLPDKIVAGLTARQAAIASVATLILWAAFEATRRILPIGVFAAFAVPVALAATALVIGHRDGLPLDRLLLAAWRQARSPRRLAPAPDGTIPAPPGWAAAATTTPGSTLLAPPAPLVPLWQQITPDGLIGLGSDGAAAVTAVSTVNFALRSPAERDGLTSAYGRWLNSLTGPAQILIRAGRADLTGAITALREGAPALPHPKLETAALAHADFLADLAAQEHEVLTRQVLLVIREPAHGTGRAAGTAAARAAQRAAEAARLLAGADLQVSVLDGGQVTALLAACANPSGTVQAARLAVPGQPITRAGRPA